MVDSVNLKLVNPFTNEVLTAEQIAALDKDNNGIVDHDEWNAGQSYLKESADAEGVSSVGESKVFDKLIADGDIKANVNTQAELKTALAAIADEYLETYLTKNKALSSEEKALVKSAVNNVAKTFPDQYIKKYPNGPYDVKTAAIEMEIKIEEKIIEKKNTKSLNDNIINGYQKNTEDNWENLLKSLSSAMENDNVSTKEYNQIKNKLIQYLMGSLLNGENNDEFFASLNKNYKNNADYKKIASCIKTIQESSDPDAVKQAVIDLQTLFTAFINSCKQDDVLTAIGDKQNKEIENKAKSYIAPAADKWKNDKIKNGMSQDEITFIDKFITDATAKFIASITETGEISTLTEQNMQILFTEFLDTTYAELKKQQDKLDVEPSALDKAHENLINITDKANENKSISNEEKAQIVDAATDLIYKQLISGMKDIPLLQNLGAQFGNLETLMNNLKNATTADEITAIQKQIQDAIKEILNKYSGTELVNAINKTKPLNVSDSQKTDIIFNSAIYADYEGNTVRGGQLYIGTKNKEAALSSTQEKAKADLAIIAESLKVQLKKELGDAYDDALVQECINSAINDTIAQFTQNLGGEGGFKIKRTGLTKCIIYNVKELTDTFITKFNEAAKVNSANKNDPNKATYDKEDVIQEAELTNGYYRNTKVHNEDNRSEVIAEAKKTLEQAASSLRVSLIKQGCTIPLSVIDTIIEDSMKETMDEYDFDQTARYEKLKCANPIVNRAIQKSLSNTFHTKELVDMFLDKVDKKINDEKEKASAPTN